MYLGRIVLKDYKYTKTGLWMVPLSETIPQSPARVQKSMFKPARDVMNHLQEASYSSTETSSKAELAMFHHQTLGSPPKSTLLKAITGFQLKLFPGLTYDLIQKNLP